MSFSINARGVSSTIARLTLSFFLRLYLNGFIELIDLIVNKLFAFHIIKLLLATNKFMKRRPGTIMFFEMLAVSNNIFIFIILNCITCLFVRSIVISHIFGDILYLVIWLNVKFNFLLNIIYRYHVEVLN